MVPSIAKGKPAPGLRPRSVAEFVEMGDIGLASGPKAEGTHEQVRFKQLVPTDEVMFEAGVFLALREKAEALKTGIVPEAHPVVEVEMQPDLPATLADAEVVARPTLEVMKTLRLIGDLPPEVWNRLGTKLIPKLKSVGDLHVGVEFEVRASAAAAKTLVADLRQVLHELGLAARIRIEER